MQVTEQLSQQPLHINIELNSSDLETCGPRLVCLVKQDWICKTIHFEKLTDGLSNKLLAMFPSSKDEQSLIVRIYGKNSDLIVDRKVEIQTMVRLSQYNMSNQVLLTFNNGFLYTYVPGEQINIDNESVDLLVASKLAEYHSIPSDDDNQNKKQQLIEKLRHYLNLLNGTNPQLQERLKTLKSPTMGVLGTIKATVGLQSWTPSLDSLESILDYSWSQLADDIDAIENTLNQNWSNIPVVFCHNDTQSRNFLLDKKTHTLRIIDFEHCFHNLYLFDIANYFVEFAGLGSSPDWPSKYPSVERRKTFLAEYLKHARFLNCENIENEPDKLSERCYRLIALTHLYWSLWALLEALINSEALSQFDYVTYSKSRFNQYKLHKSHFFAS
ncbi:unnamed protein product [Adineta steineri]|uniref:ethanolamine kinase n=1 Tax=Adineta steineri TaxID=433720 RepID=A0A819A528_9BILA|nr:unnamed protein product [Adineta steineri]